ncbi:hypothetical protein D3C80_2119560 [compost metagenome]
MIPSLLTPVSVNTYRLPENNKMPMANDAPAHVTRRPGICVASNATPNNASVCTNW